MAKTATQLPVEALNTYLADQENKSILRFLTCGSVDDGKSTLIGAIALRHQAIV